MDLRGVRTLNLVATIIFGIFSLLIPMIYIPTFGFLFFMTGSSSLGAVCISIFLIWILAMVFVTYKLYTSTVRSIDEGDYDTAKRWTIYGAILGFLFAGIIPLILFIISYISFDDALRRQFYPPAYGYYPPPAYYPPPPPPPAYSYPPPGYAPPGYPPPGYPYGQQERSSSYSPTPERISETKRMEVSNSKKS